MIDSVGFECFNKTCVALMLKCKGVSCGTVLKCYVLQFFALMCKTVRVSEVEG